MVSTVSTPSTISPASPLPTLTQRVLALGYVRRSTNRQEESLDQQRQKLASFAAARGWELAEVYADDAISGSQMRRPGLESLIQHAQRAPEIGVVLAWERNRLARPKDPVDGLLLERRLIEAGKRVFYVATGQEADRSFTSGLVGFVEHYQNGDYLRKLSRDVTRGLVARARRGLWPTGKIPFGFDRLCLAPDGTPRRIVRNLTDGTQLILHPDTRAVIEHVRDGFRYRKPDHETVTLIASEESRVHIVQRLFADYRDGVPLRVLRDRLNSGGQRSVHGGGFTNASLHTFLRNPAYKGTLVFNRNTTSKWHRFIGGPEGRSVERHDEAVEPRPAEDWIVVENAWPALVDGPTFDAVQERLDGLRKKFRPVTSGQAVRAGYLLSGLLRCGVCGGNLMGQTNRQKRADGSQYVCKRYVCGVHHNGDYGRCPTRYVVPVEDLEAHVWQYIKSDLAHLKGDEQLHACIHEELAKVCGSQLDAKENLRKRLANLDSQIARLTTHLAALDTQTATTLGLYAKAKTLADEREQVRKQLEAIHRDVPDMPSPREIACRAEESLNQLDTLLESGTLEEKRELIRTYVKAATVDPKAQIVELSVLPALFSWIGTVVNSY